MRLRKQLLLLSLVTLALPWAGCQYLREFQHTIELGQAQALSTAAKALAARIQNDPETLRELQVRYSEDNSDSLFSHKLKTSPIIDGYDEEWRAQFLAPVDLKYSSTTPQQKKITCDSFSTCTQNDIEKKLTKNSVEEFSARVVTGFFQHKLSLFIYVKDKEIHYFNPTLEQKNYDMSNRRKNSIFLYDNVRIYTKKDSQKSKLQVFEISAAGPGNIRAQVYNQNEPRVEHRLKGKWLENSTGYQVELEMPVAWSDNGLSIQVNNAEKNETLVTTERISTDVVSSEASMQNFENSYASLSLPPLITQSTVLDRALNIFLRDDLFLYITNPQRHLIARSESGKIKTDNTLPWLLRIIYQFILEDSRDDHLISNITISKKGTRKTLTAKEALKHEGNTLGYIHVEQRSDSLASATNSAFSRLILYSVITTLLVSLTLIFYASWLSFRIRSLSRAAQKAVSEKGAISTDFPSFKVKDEISELSRNYSELLSRLHEYTRYLQTLSSKLSHELRTPLAIVTSSLDNLSLSKLDKDAANYTHRAQSGAKRLSATLTAMSSASRIEQAIESAETLELDLMEILPDLTEAYRSAYPNIEPILQIAHSTPPLKILGVPELIVQLLDKLIDNAADFSPSGAEVLIKAEHQNDYIALSVTNRGPLLPEHMKAQLFDSLVSLRKQTHHEIVKNTSISQDNEPYQQASHLGLGLFIVRLICDFHGGKVKADNLGDGSGVIFTVLLPSLGPAESASPSKHKPNDSP